MEKQNEHFIDHWNRSCSVMVTRTYYLIYFGRTDPYPLSHWDNFDCGVVDSASYGQKSIMWKWIIISKPDRVYKVRRLLNPTGDKPSGRSPRLEYDLS